MRKTTQQPPRDPYQSPASLAVEVFPSQIICGSNEDITPGEEIDWTAPLDMFEGLL